MLRLIIEIIFAISTITAGVHSASESSNMPPKTQFMVHLIGTREGWPDNMTAEEEKIMSEHFDYLKNLTAAKKVILAGPCFGLRAGIIVLQTESEAEARQIMDSEPSVRQGVHKYELYPMVVSLLTDYQAPSRYPKEISDRVLKKEIVIPAPRADVWRAWTTTDGVKSFMSPEARVELRVGGPFEIYFVPSSPPGMRGSEGCRFLSFLPMEILSFEWNAPPQFGELRYQHTQVIMRFFDVPPDSTRLEFFQYGWGQGEKWDSVYSYFERAWGNVLENLRKRFAEGPLNFEAE